MVHEPTITEREVFEQAGAGVVSLLTLAAANSGAPLPVQGAMAVAGSVIGLGFGRSVFRAATRRFPALARGFLSALDPDPKGAGAKAKDASESETFGETLDDLMMRAFRQMMDAVDDAVVPVLGYMAGRYTFERRRPDAFFRGLGRVLCDLEHGELEQLRRIVALAAYGSHSEVALRVDRGAVKLMARDSRKELRLAAASRIFSLMKREGLAKEYFPDADENRDPADPFIPSEWVIVEKSVIEKLCDILMAKLPNDP